MEGVGAWFVQIGDLNTVHHLWQFANLEERKVRCERSWKQEGRSQLRRDRPPQSQVPPAQDDQEAEEGMGQAEGRRTAHAS
ncbi:hypothetical protein GGR56DRAFT_645466, partial [Xylariaceae sp. FL0804]